MQGRSFYEALARTRRTAFGRLASLIGASELTPQFWRDLETGLIQADVGIGMTSWLLDESRQAALERGFRHAAQALGQLESLMTSQFPYPRAWDELGKPGVIFLVGVNGSGKTTTVAKLAWRYLQAGKSVMLAAADTYRAAAIEQLQVWGERLDVQVIAGQTGGEPAAVVYTACQAASSGQVEILLVDTSGRMHTSHNLMAELEKAARVAGKVVAGAPHQVLLVLDATTGQNSLDQAHGFTKVLPVTGAVLAKLDSSSRGGMALSIAKELSLPILYAGTGESLEDLASFEPGAYVSALLSDMKPELAGRNST